MLLKIKIFNILFFLCCAFASAYDVVFEGIDDPALLDIVKANSLLVKLKDTPPATQIGLKRRAENDLTNIIHALHSKAYYEAHASFTIQDSTVVIHVNLGPAYTLAAFTIRYATIEKPSPEINQQIPLEVLKIELNCLALPEIILDAEEAILDRLNLMGYAFASIKNREITADQKEKKVSVLIDVETGPLTYFGPVKIKGNERLCTSYFFKKLQWCEGDLYNPVLVNKTQEALELSGLFRSVYITHGEKAEKGDLLPIEISVREAKQRSIGFGLNYNTDLGPGISAEWEDRNIYGEGQKLAAKLDLWVRRQEGTLIYAIPDFLGKDRNLIWSLDYHHENLKAFTDRTLAISGTIDRKLNEKMRFSYGGMYKLIRTEHSTNNGTFDLIQAPLQFRWSNADSLMEPTKGGSMTFKVIPSMQILHPYFGYCVNTFTGVLYHSLTPDKRFIFAAKLMLGSIFGTSNHEIPPPERFYAGTENALRGYKYLTVSPIGPDHKPLGGRSLFIYSLELRTRFWDSFGGVLFYEIGNVYSNPYPDNRNMLQSGGVGIRYFTPVGPLRLDVAIPFNRRPHIDGPFEIYFSIGQSF